MIGQEWIDIIQPVENTACAGVFLVLLQVNPYVVYIF